MNTYQVDSKQWQSKLDKVSRSLADRKLNIEVIGMDVGSVVEAESVVLKGLTFDPKSNIIEITSNNFEHMIQSPTAIYFSEDRDALKSIEIIDSENRKQILTFKDQLLLK